MPGFEAFADVERAIVVAAHPDDLETMMGGTVARLVQRGATVYSVNCTLGDIGSQDGAANPALSRAEISRTRLLETDAAAAVLGLSQVINLGHHDGELVPDLKLRAQIARLYRLTQADTLFTFDPYWTGQMHPDHRAVGQAALDAYMPSKMPLYHPEHLNETGAGLGRVRRVFLFGTEREPDIFVDVEAVYATKLAACRAHVSQFPQGDDSLQWMMQRDRAHAAAGEGDAPGGPVEPFKSVRVW